MKARILALLLFVFAGREAAAQAIVNVPAQGTLQQAIASVADGGIIEMAAGTYIAPAGGFQIGVPKRFTIRAATGANVTLSGNNSTDIVRVMLGKPITFERLRFTAGRSNDNNQGGAVTLSGATATFIGCAFEVNSAVASDAGGGAIRAVDSDVFIADSLFSGNSARRYGGAIASASGGSLVIHNTGFYNNRVNLPNHWPDSLGGAIFLLDVKTRVTNSRFETNQAGFAGGAIYSFGSWPAGAGHGMEVLIANSTFSGNIARYDPSASSNTITCGGALQMEDSVHGVLHNTRFLNNQATQGGAISNYRGALDIYSGTFQGNVASTNGSVYEGIGGAVHLVSDDQVPSDPANRPSASLLVRDTLFQGRSGAVTNNGRIGGCLFSAGDGNRAFGTGGIPVMGSIASNRATIDIADSVFANCAVRENGGGGIGGAIITQMTAMSIRDTLFVGNEALQNATNTGTGGAMALFDHSTTNLLRTTMSKSRAGFVGGAILLQGSHLDIDDSAIVESALLGPSIWGGTAIYTAPENLGPPRPGVDATGVIRNSIISNSSGGVTLLDFEPGGGPFNRVQYSNNQIFPGGAGTYSAAGFPAVSSVAQMNNLVTNGQPKAPVPNSVPATAPVVAALASVPKSILSTSAFGDPAPPTSAYLAAAWSGASATLDGAPVSGNHTVVAAGSGTHTLLSGALQRQASIGLAPVPAFAMAIRPAQIGPGGGFNLVWQTLAGNFLDVAFDQEIAPPGSASGNFFVPSWPATQLVRGLVITREGGAVASDQVTVVNGLIFKDGFEP
ncbi:hypothetical protein [Tahibacter harae]|uniref:Outer membrane repeat protein n=1 Tax=Tahibacter harae TaxID=2963937 RepID=A0ABT1QXJ5_9GAMM|nr:hypothetical protein [Tahibacter harae]MCQ4166976.1 hypothetical protein [Tahibacter harae]